MADGPRWIGAGRQKVTNLALRSHTSDPAEVGGLAPGHASNSLDLVPSHPVNQRSAWWGQFRVQRESRVSPL